MGNAQAQTELMPAVVLQPTGMKNHKATVEDGVPLKRFASFLDSKEMRHIRSLFPDGAAGVWGLTPKAEKRWLKLKEGDIVLFAGKGKIISQGVVAHKTRNSALAVALWGQDSSGRTWELIYFVRNVRPVDMSYETFNTVAGYSPLYIAQTMFFLPNDKAQAVLTALRAKSR